MSASTAFFHVTQTSMAPYVTTSTGASAIAICATDTKASSYSLSAHAALHEPIVSLRTYSDTERARLTGAGLLCDALTARSFTNLVGDYVTNAAFLPPSAAALASAYLDLSNQIVKASVDPPADPTVYGALRDTYQSTSILNPPTANALRGAFYSLSNLIAVRLGAMSNDIAKMVQSTSGNVLASITKSIVSAAVAAASNGGSNIAGSECDPCCGYQQEEYVGDANVIVVYVNVNTSNSGTSSGGTSGGTSGGSNNAATGFSLLNDEYIRTPEGQSRFYFETSGATTIASAGNGENPDDIPAFKWFVNDMEQNVMELSGSGALWVRRTLQVAGGTDLLAGLAVHGQTALIGNATLSAGLTVNGGTTLVGDASVRGALTVRGAATMSNTATFLGDVALLGNSLTMGSQVEIRYLGSNIGINLPYGAEPVCALHVNGSVFSEEGLYELSDQSVKTDIVPLKDALEKCMRIRGCSYQRTDVPLRQIGVIAQNVKQVVPEAVHVGSDGRMSVAYGNLVALAIEAIREVSQNQRAIVERLDRIEGIHQVPSDADVLVTAEHGTP
jgi:hypothetical protein